MQLNGFDCALSTAAGRLAEYTDESTRRYDNRQKDDTKTVYVQAEDDAHFAFHVKAQNYRVLEFGQTEPQVRVKLTIDGTDAPSSTRWTRKETLSGIKDDIVSFFVEDKKSRTTQVERRKLKFAAISLLDEQPEKKNMLSPKTLQEIGEFKVAIRRGHLSKELIPCGSSREMSTSENAVCEKNVKGRDVSHRIGLEKAKLEPFESHFQEFIPYEPYHKSPYATFRFLYRSKKALQNLDLIERTPVQEDDDHEEPSGIKREPVDEPSGIKREPVEKPTGIKRERVEKPAGIKREPVDEPAGINIPKSKRAKPEPTDLA